MNDPQHEETFADTERKLREIITTLRAQLAAETARADRAEAERAAQIEADAGIADLCKRQNGPLSLKGQDPYIQGLSSAGQAIAAAIRAQPHSRTALDRYRETVLREAADELKGQGYNTAVRQIRALIEREGGK